MRNIIFSKNNYYLLSNSSANSTNIFVDDTDKTRLLFMILNFQSPTRINNSSWYVNNFMKKGSFRMGDKNKTYLINTRNIELIGFYIDKTSFKVLVRSLEDFVPSAYMHRIQTGYGRYFNSKYKKSGHVFGGPFKAKLISDKKTLIDESAKIYISSMEQNQNTSEYTWSSFIDYTKENRWGELLKTRHILNDFKTQTEYEKFIKSYK